MKKQLLYITTVFLAVQFATAQLLYTEDFESYSTGTFSNDLTGTAPAQGGWYTQSMGNGTASVNDYKIVATSNQGNTLKIVEGKSFVSGSCRVYRTDLNTYWHQRTTGNN